MCVYLQNMEREMRWLEEVIIIHIRFFLLFNRVSSFAIVKYLLNRFSKGIK